MTPMQIAAVVLVAWAPTLVLAGYLKWRQVKNYSDMIRIARSMSSVGGAVKTQP